MTRRPLSSLLIPAGSPLIFLAVLMGFSQGCFADVRLPSVLGNKMVLQRDKPVNIWGWADKGESVKVTFGSVNASATAGEDGRWSVVLPALKASAEPQSLLVKGNNTIELRDILVGEVWLCSGQSNMEWPMNQSEHGAEEIKKADQPRIRLFNIHDHIGKPAPQDDVPATWEVCSPGSVAKFSAVGYHFGKDLIADLDVPIGLIGANWGGTQIEPWTPKVGLEQVEALKAGAANGAIYNGMIHPLAPYTMRGIIWYQGESNCIKGDTEIYTDRTMALLKGWRTVFKQDDLPFYYVQIAPFIYKSRFADRNKDLTEENLPRFWEAQQACLKADPLTGMVVVTDVTGNVRDIHPRNKRDVGARLARLALAKTYGKDGVVYSGPVYKSIKVEGGKAILSFDHVGGGLKSLDDMALSHFKIAGKDRNFIDASAEIVGDTVVVSAEGVGKPVAVRFAWHETAVGNLGCAEGLPAVPFRTDNW